MIKKIALICGLVFLLIPFNSAFASAINNYPISSVAYGENNNATNVFNGTVLSKLQDDDLSSWGVDINPNGGAADTFVVDLGSNLTFPSSVISVLSDTNLNLSVQYLSSNKSVLSTYTVSFNGVSLPGGTNVRFISISNKSTLGAEISEIDVMTGNEPVYDEISNLNYSLSNNNDITLTYDIPLDNDGYSGSKIYRNGVLIDTLDNTTNVYSDNDLDYDTTYIYKITALYSDGFETEGTIKTVTTEKEKEKEPLELKEVEAEATFDRVDLSWVLPKNNELKHVNIYRDTLGDEQTALQTFFFGESVKAAETKIFETNGTYFNDLTVEPERTYEYTLSITDTSGQETGYTDIEVTTPEEPAPIISDGSLEEQENGDYKYSWSEPTDGSVKIIVGGKEYATVAAAEKQILIPKADMKYTAIGDPDVQAIPISESGKEGEPVKTPTSLQDMELPFGVRDLLSTGSGLLWWIAPFVLLGLSFLLVPKLRNLIVNVVRGKNKNGTIVTERRTKSELTEKEKKESDRLEKEQKEIKKEPIEKQGKKLRSVRVRERQIKEPTARRERMLKEPKVSRVSREQRESRQPRQATNRTREAREGRQSERIQRMPREPRQGR